MDRGADEGRGSVLHGDINHSRNSMAGKPDGELALIVDGISLEGLWTSNDLKVKFIEIVQFVPIVIACRVSPLQKAALVRMVKSAPNNPVTMSIGKPTLLTMISYPANLVSLPLCLHGR